MFIVRTLQNKLIHSSPPDGAVARSGPWPPLQCASRPLDSLFCLSIHLFKPIFLRSMDTSSSHLIFWPSSSSCCIQLSVHLFWNCGVLHSFYVTKPPYSLAFNEPDDVLSPPWLWLLIRRLNEYTGRMRSKHRSRKYVYLALSFKTLTKLQEIWTFILSYH
jgi:hypothetical protein